MTENKVKILIVDDQPSVWAVLKGLLLPAGYDLVFVTNGLEALAHLDEIQPDTILLDVMMPSMDGFEVCRQIKAEGRWQHIPIILVTALDSKEDVARGLDAGADDFLHKPVNGLELRARVRSMLRLKKQFDELQAALQLREDMAAMLVHDMRNPLTPILGLSELLLLQGNLPPEHCKDIETIRTQAYQLNSFLNDLLLLAKIEQGKLNLNYSSVDINQLVLTTVENHRFIAQSRHINIIVDLPSEPQPLWLDATLLQRVLDNLVSNALRYSPPQSAVTIKVEYPRQTAPTEPTPWLRLKVLDKGPGIALKYRDSIFEKFKVVELKKKHVPQVGLGLAFCKLVVEAHGGRIFMEDNQPKGSVFIVEI